ncbi:MAG TPA: hypothetical protein VK065_06620 [Brevibacterium sp.]|nr:hypothetical protein [Brevibacterium sp.]
MNRTENRTAAQASARSWRSLVEAMDTATGIRATGPAPVSIEEYTDSWERAARAMYAAEERAA